MPDPAPTPQEGESQDSFISRCIKSWKHADPDRADDQVAAICYSAWRKHHKKKKEDCKVIASADMFYPEIGLLKPTMRFYQCPRCYGNLRSQLKSQIQRPDELIFVFECHDCEKNWYISSKLVLNSVFEDEVQRMADYTKATGKEFGGLIVKTPSGVRIEMIQVGENMSVSFGQTHNLEDGESLIGTIHNHPYTDIPSDWDIGTFLRTEWEHVSIVNGVKGTINIMVKTHATLRPDNLEQWIKDNESLTFKAKGNLYNFIIYRGRVNNLQQLTSFPDVLPVTSIEELLRLIK